MGRDWLDHDVVCCDPLGRPLSPRRVSNAFAALCHRLDLKVSFHGLRHGFASMLHASEVHPKVVQTALGHSSIQVRIDTYSHLLPSMGRDAASKIDRAIRTLMEPKALNTCGTGCRFLPPNSVAIRWQAAYFKHSSDRQAFENILRMGGRAV